MLLTLFSRLKNSFLPSGGIEEGDPLPEFQLENQDGRIVNSSEINDAIIFFYPRALTPGCTREACNFRDAFSHFEGLDMNIYGISTDNVKNQRAFYDSEDLNYYLLADPKGKVCSKFGVLARSGMAKRTTFVVKNGRIRKIFRKVNPEKHVEEVLESLR